MSIKPLPLKVYLTSHPSQDETLFHQIYQNLSNSLKERINKQKRLQDKWRIIASDRLIRTVLGAELDLPQESIMYHYAPTGKPYLENGKRHFNIAHSNDIVLMVTASTPVGVDIEYIKPLEDLNELLQNFTEAEQNILRNETEQNRLIAFFKLWVIKESYLKATGDGLSVPLDNVEVVGFLEDQPTIKGHHEWQIKPIETLEGYQAAICTQEKVLTDQVISVPFEKLISSVSM